MGRGQKYLSANDKTNKQVKLGAVLNSRGIYHAGEKNSGKTQLGDRLMNAVRPNIASNFIGKLHSTSGREGKKESTRRIKSSS